MLLTLDNVKRHYPVTRGVLGTRAGLVRAVDGVDLAVNQGETLGLVGESGCGKSTLARLVLRLERPDAGSIAFQDKPLDDWDGRDLSRRIQMVFQDPYSSLDPRQKVGSIVAEPLAIHNQGDRKQRRDKAAELLRLVGLRPEHAGRYPHEFSGGQRQRVAIARALALEPKLVVCDEPVSALDVSIRAQVLNLLKDLQDRFGLTYLFITHDLSVVGHLCDRVAVMYLGRVVELSPAAALFSQPLHPYTQALLDAVPRPDPDDPGARSNITGDPPSPLNPPQGCRFHPRCPRVMDICSRQEPALLEVRPGLHAACWLHQNSQDQGEAS